MHHLNTLINHQSSILKVELSILERARPDSPTMDIPVAKEEPLPPAEMSQSDLPLQVMGTSASLSSQHMGLEQDVVPLNSGGKTKKPLSFYMTFLALNICVLLVSLDATALSVVVPVRPTPPGHKYSPG